MRLLSVIGSALALLAATCVPAAAASANLLRASSDSQIIQNRRADADDLSRMSDANMIQRFANAGLLVRVPGETQHYYTRYISTRYSYLRPWSKLFLDRLGAQYYARFKQPLRVTSMVRTVSLQVSMAKNNGNAAAAYGERRSSHLTGATLDISKNGMSQAGINWMREVLYSLRQQGFLYAVEEFSQPTFHIMVYKNYPEYVAGLQARRSEQGAD